jgi:hypothetical protein
VDKKTNGSVANQSGNKETNPTKEANVRGLKFVVLTISFFVVLTISSSVLSQERMASPMNRCDQVITDYISTEHEWSFINTDVRFFRDGLERLRNLRWETKITLSVLDDALKALKGKGSLTDAQRLTLNSRIPNNKGTINPDGTFTIRGLETAPLKLEEARELMYNLLIKFEDDIKKTEADLLEIEKRSHLLSQKLAGLEKLVESECKASGNPTPWEKGISRAAEKDLYQRYTEKERRRQEEVENRRLADIERAWSRGYFSYPYPLYLPPLPYPHHPYD